MLVFGQQILGALLHLLLQLVVGVPRRKYGEEVGAFIIKKPGSTITEDVPDAALAIARARQVNKT